MTYKQLTCYEMLLARCVLVSVLLLPGLSHADLENDFRKILEEEVRLEIGVSPLVKDVVEIRFTREFDAWKKRQQQKLAELKPVLNPSSQGVSVAIPAPSSVYVAGGTRVVVGHSNRVSSGWGWRVQVSGTESRTGSETVGVNRYHAEETNLSAGAYLDWYPLGGGLRLSFGVNANRMRNYVKMPVFNSMTLGAKSFNSGSETLDITYKFPLYTPYVGLGYQSQSSDEKGWSVYGDLGWMYGRYDAYARTSLVGMHSVTAQDVDREMNAIRDSLYKHSYVRLGVLGLAYRY